MMLRPTSIKETLTFVAFLAVIFSACGGSREETIAGIQIPVPSGMSKTEGQGVQVSLPGFGGGQASFQGKVEPERIVEFYKKEMPARGWKPGMGILSRGGMLTFTKEGKSILVAVGKTNGSTSLSITVGKSGS